MKKIVLLLVIVVVIICGWQIKKKNTEEVVTSQTDYSVEGSSEEPSGESEKKEEKSKENVYKEQMDLVYQALSQEWSVDKYFENEISSLISNHYEENALENVGYVLKDLDGDGKDELIISAVSKDSSAGMIYDVYSGYGNVVLKSNIYQQYRLREIIHYKIFLGGKNHAKTF